MNAPSDLGVIDTGIDITRFNIPRTTMESDPLTARITRELSLWYGPNTGMANTSIWHEGEWWNGFDVLHERCPSSAPGPGQRQDLDDLKRYFEFWGPTMQKLFSYLQEAYVWRIIESRPAKWVSESGRVVLLGDAAHAVLPHSGQGGGLAIEDAASVAECLSRARSVDDIPRLLHIFETIRRPRTEMVQNLGRAMKGSMFLPDGPEQQARDKRLATFKAWQYNEPWDGKHVDEIPKSINAPNYAAWSSGHDAILYVGCSVRQLDDFLTKSFLGEP